MKRRKFLQVAGVTGAGLAAGCGTGEPDKWMPYLVPPEDIVPGVPTYYATTCRECPAGCGILVKTREGLPTKIEGYPQHPVNRGRLCARGQAALQGLYNPDRFTQPMKRTGDSWAPISWEQAETELSEALASAQSAGRDRIAFVSGAGSGPLDRLTDAWLTAFGSARRLRYEAFAYEPLREANRLTFGVATVPQHDFAAAHYILSFGADFLETWLSPTENARGFAASHAWNNGRMAKFVAVEPRRGMTGFSADEWIAPRPGTEHLVALAIANAIVRSGRSRATGGDGDALRGFLARFDAATVAGQADIPAEAIERLAREFSEASPSLAVGGGVAGQHAAATQTAVAVNILNAVAGNIGRTVFLPASSVWDRVARYRDMTGLVDALNQGSVDVMLVHGTNPVYSMAAGSAFAEAFSKARLKVSFADCMDETTALCDLVLPDHHSLESWDLVEPMGGVTSVVQPAVRPIHDTRQAFDVLLSVATRAGKTVAPAGVTTARGMVERALGANAEAALQRGGTFAGATPRAARLSREFARLEFAPVAFAGQAGGPVLLPVPSPMLYDGRGANKPWLREIPDPATKITWQSWIELHPETAASLGVANGDSVSVTVGSRAQTFVAYVYPGVRRDVVAVPLGNGHTNYGRWASAPGANAMALLDNVADSSGALALVQGRAALGGGAGGKLATTEGSSRQHGRGIARITAAADIRGGVHHEEHVPLTQVEQQAIRDAAAAHAAKANLDEYARPHPKWEMVIDLSRCTGCSACMAACYAENNVPTVGMEQVQKGREMHWIRLERYFEGDTSGTNFQVAQIPMLCQHCQNAPCEPVCPVYAAYHTPDGLNGQIYNRCVGTRYCANNCPYKVRYFNWWDYGQPGAPKYAFPGTLAWQLNPDVTVRTKGVMEKCTMCVQRIRFAQNDARVRGRELRDGEFTTACAQTCPSGAITFGNALDASSQVSHLKHDERHYTVFEILNTKPGITYLSRVVDAQPAAGGGEH